MNVTVKRKEIRVILRLCIQLFNTTWSNKKCVQFFFFDVISKEKSLLCVNDSDHKIYVWKDFFSFLSCSLNSRNSVLCFSFFFLSFLPNWLFMLIELRIKSWNSTEMIKKIRFPCERFSFFSPIKITMNPLLRMSVSSVISQI